MQGFKSHIKFLFYLGIFAASLLTNYQHIQNGEDSFVPIRPVDVVLESDVNILDIAALSVIVNEAGGVFTDLDGNAPDLGTTTVLAAGTKALHTTALNQLLL